MLKVHSKFDDDEDVVIKAKVLSVEGDKVCVELENGVALWVGAEFLKVAPVYVESSFKEVFEYVFAGQVVEREETDDAFMVQFKLAEDGAVVARKFYDGRWSPWTAYFTFSTQNFKFNWRIVPADEVAPDVVDEDVCDDEEEDVCDVEDDDMCDDVD